MDTAATGRNRIVSMEHEMTVNIVYVPHAAELHRELKPYRMCDGFAKQLSGKATPGPSRPSRDPVDA